MANSQKRRFLSAEHNDCLENSRPSKYPRGDSWQHSGDTSHGSSQFNGSKRSPKIHDLNLADRRRETARGSQKKKNKGNRADSGEGGKTKGLSDKIHSLRRLLEKATDLPADVYQEKERELQGYLAEQKIRQVKKENRALTSRYHFVRFLERKRADKHLKRLRKEFEIWQAANDATLGERTAQGFNPASAQETIFQQGKKYKRQLHEAEVDLNYTLYAPLDQKYVALYPASSKSKSDSAIKQETSKQCCEDGHPIDEEAAGLLRNSSGQKPPLWYAVESAMEHDELEALRDGKLLKGARNVDHRVMVDRDKKSSDGNAHGNDEEVMSDEEDFFER